MRTLRLAQVAAEAEVLRLRQLARRHSRRAIYGVIAAVFGLGAVVAAHVTLALMLAQWMRPVWAVLIVTGIDLLIAIVFALVARRDQPSRAELEALAVRRSAQHELLADVAFMTLLRPLWRVVRRRLR